MTIMAETPAPAVNQAPAKLRKHTKRARILEAARNHPDPLVRYNVAVRRGRVSASYLADAYECTVDGDAAPAMDPAADPTYRTPTTSAELAADADRQLIAATGTGAATISAAARFALRRPAPGAPAMGLADLMALEPHRAYRALADLLDEDYIHSPYTQLADRLLNEEERTDEAARAVMAADEDFPAEQMSLAYRSPAEKIMDTLASGESEPEPVQDVYERPDLTPELVYTPAEQDYDETGRLTVQALQEGDTDAWWEADTQGRRNDFVALAAEIVDLWADEPWLEADITLQEADQYADPSADEDVLIGTIITDTERNTTA